LTKHVVNFIHVESLIHVTKFIQFINGIHVLEHKLTQLSLLKNTQKNTYFIFTKIVKYHFYIIRQMTQNPNLPNFPNYPKIIYFTFPIPNWSPY
jgi:hypothetical protein